MLEVSESPQPTQSIELHRDQNKNVWFIFNCEPQVTSIIDGQVKSRAVVTPNGLKFAHGKRRDELLLRALHQQLQNNGTLGRPGAEGVVKKND